MKAWRILAVAALVALGVPPAAAISGDEAPYIGVWDCEVAVFTFTRESYDNGTDILPMRQIEIADRGYVMTFDDDYQIAIALDGEDSMSWLSLASGDAFDCRRLYY